ncbi:MAG: SLC13 family permease [Oscillospiraceae bacterium]
MKLAKNHKIHLLVSAAAFVLLQFIIPVQFGLTDAGKTFLCIFIPLVYLWITVDTFIPSFLALTLFGVLQVTKSSALFQGTFGNATVAIFLFANVMINLARECGVMKKIALWFLSRRITAGHPFVFLFLLALANFVLGALLTNAYSLMITIPLVFSICESLDSRRGERFYIAVFLVSMWASLGGGIAFPFAKSIYLSLNAATEGFGITISYARVILMGLPVGFIWMLCGLPVVKYVLRPDFTKFKAYDPAVIRAELQASPMDRRAKFATWGFFIMTFVWSLTVFSGVFGFAKYLNTIGFHIISCVVIAVLCLIQVEGQPVINLRKAIPALNWPVIGFLAVIMFTSSAMNSAEYGIKEFLITLLSPVLSGVSPAMLIIIGICLAALLTNLMSNNVTVVVVVSVFAPLLLAIPGVSTASIMSFCLATCIAAGMSCITPAAFPGAPLVLGEHVSVKESYLASSVMVVIGAIICCVASFIF